MSQTLREQLLDIVAEFEVYAQKELETRMKIALREDIDKMRVAIISLEEEEGLSEEKRKSAEKELVTGRLALRLADLLCMSQKENSYERLKTILPTLIQGTSMTRMETLELLYELYRSVVIDQPIDAVEEILNSLIKEEVRMLNK
jgi:hypothetical protein